MEYGYWPAPSIHADVDDFDNMTDEELERYFANYVPLSNLPTPPPAKEVQISTPATGTDTAAADVNIAVQGSKNIPSLASADRHSPEIEVYAKHLSKLVPNNVSSQLPCPATIAGFLERSKLSAEVVAFAACLLDALSQGFASAWRAACLTPNAFPNAAFTLKEADSTRPEVIVLAALAVAHGFLSDNERSAKQWARTSDRMFSVRELEATKRCLLQDIDYGLARISADMVADMLRDMQLAMSSLLTKQPAAAAGGTLPCQKEDKKCPKLHLEWHGAAIWEHGVQTPEPSPRGNSAGLC